MKIISGIILSSAVFVRDLSYSGFFMYKFFLLSFLGLYIKPLPPSLYLLEGGIYSKRFSHCLVVRIGSACGNGYKWGYGIACILKHLLFFIYM